uniref:rac GTPase-activating protein 1-like n=1 Tax=Myxine glutinosa TaxID=7769 RepID=UPI00358E442D
MELLAQNVKEGLPWELLYAEDLVFIAESIDGLKEKMNKWKECMETKGHLMASVRAELIPLFDYIVCQKDILSYGCEREFAEFVRCMEDCRQQWAETEKRVLWQQEALAKTEAERVALDVKLKHARNQVDVEIKRRHQAEMECEKLDHQIQLMRDLLIGDQAGSLRLSAEQCHALSMLNGRGMEGTAHPGKATRLTTIDESSRSFVSPSDISYDRTDEDLDNSFLRSGRKYRREKRKPSHEVEVKDQLPPVPAKRSCVDYTGQKLVTLVDKGDSILATTMVTVPPDGGPVEAVSTLSPVPRRRSSRGRRLSISEMGLEQDGPPAITVQYGDASVRATLRQHTFVTKTVIKSESCVPCKKRIKFGKASLKCRDCKIISHMECRDLCPLPCNPTELGTPTRLNLGTLADFVPVSPPFVPPLVRQCVSEIEHRGLTEIGIYRVPGCIRTIKEMHEQFVQNRALPPLSRIQDINVVCGLLKDFLRCLREPLLTHRLHPAFLSAAEITDEDNSKAAILQVVAELPCASQDTLAFLIIHLQKVAASEVCQMGVSNLARVFGPTLVGHATADPNQNTMLHDARRQPIVIERMLSIPKDYWSRFLTMNKENCGSPNLDGRGTQNFGTPVGSMLGPLSTPQTFTPTAKTSSTSSLSKMVRSTLGCTTPKFGSRSKQPLHAQAQRKAATYFESPLLH